MTGTKPSVSHLHILFCLCAVRKATAHVGTKVLKMCHQAQKGFCVISVGIPQHQKENILYVPRTMKIIYSYNSSFDEIFSTALAYASQTYAEAIAMCQDVSYIPHDTSSREKTGDIITFADFEEGNILSETQNLLSETQDNMESGN